MGVTAAVAAVASVGVAYEGQKKQDYYNRLGQDQQKEAKDIQQRRNEFNAARERRRQAAQARIARGEVAAGVGAAGLGGSSGAVQGLAATAGQAGENVGFLNAQMGFQQGIDQRNQAAADFFAQGQRAASKANFLSGAFATGAGVASSFAAPKQLKAPPGPTGATLGSGGPEI